MNRAYLEAKNLGLDEVEGLAVDLDEALSFLFIVVSTEFFLLIAIVYDGGVPCRLRQRWPSSSCRSTAPFEGPT